MKNRNLFIQLNLPEEQDVRKTLLNTWTKPPPMEYHLLNSPTLNCELAELSPHPNRVSLFDKSSIKSRVQFKKRNKERQKYKKLEQELSFLQQFIQDVKELHQSQLLKYRQTLLAKYLSEFLGEIDVECQEKSHFVRSIWNALIRIFETLFERVVEESRRKERQMLTGQIEMHRQYQERLRQLMKANECLVVTENKYKGAISQLMDSVAIVNMKLKGTKSLQEKSAIAVKQLAQKYEELKADYLDVVVSTGVDRAEAEHRLHDKEVLLLSKQLGQKDIQVKVNARANRKAARQGRVINEGIDVDLMMEEIQAQEQYDFEIDTDQKVAVKYSNVKCQTEAIVTQVNSCQTQSSYHDLQHQGIIRERGLQTVKEEPVATFNVKIQTEPDMLGMIPKKDLSIKRTHTYQIKPEKPQQPQQREPQLNASEKLTQGSTIKHLNSIEEVEGIKQVKSAHLSQTRGSALGKQLKKVTKNRQSKMFRVGDASRISKVVTQKRLKTEGVRESQGYGRKGKRNSEIKRCSELILLQELKKDVLEKWSRLKKKEKKSKFYNQAKTEQLESNCTSNIHFAIKYQNIKQKGKQKAALQNFPLHTLNSNIYLKVGSTSTPKKGLTTAKIMKTAADILQLFGTFVKEGVYSLNLAQFSIDYLAAARGQLLESEDKEKLFVQFIQACIPLAASSYMIRNFILLCGFQFKKTENRTSKSSLKGPQQDKYQERLIKNLYSSQVYTYFILLNQANCDTSSDLLKAHTTNQALMNSLEHLNVLYPNCDELILQIKGAIEQTLHTFGQEGLKLDIFKALHLVIDRILHSKAKLVQKMEPLAILYKRPLDYQFMTYMISLMTNDSIQKARTLKLYQTSYGSSYQLENLAALILIEGLELKLSPFVKIESDYRFAILKKLMHQSKSENKLMEEMAKAVTKKQLKKPEFLCLLKFMWDSQAERLTEQVLGEDLFLLNKAVLEGVTPGNKKDNFHRSIQ